MKTFALLCVIATALAAPAPQAPNANCAKTQAQLVKGIQSNLNIQAQELKGVYSLKLQGGTAGFNATQASVLAIQQRGVDIRAKNQQLAKQIQSPAADGLAIVAGAQKTEIMQVMGLKGTTDDAGTIKMLVQEVMDGTKQNQKNLEAAKGQVCGK